MHVVARAGDAVGCACCATEGSQIGEGVTQLRFGAREGEKDGEYRRDAEDVFSFHGGSDYRRPPV